MKLCLLLSIVGAITIVGVSSETNNGNPLQHLQIRKTNISILNRLISAATGQNANGSKRPTGQQNAQKQTSGGQKPKSQQKAKQQQKPKPKSGQKQNKPKTATTKKPKTNGLPIAQPVVIKPNSNKPKNSPVLPYSGYSAYSMPLSDNLHLPEEVLSPPLIEENDSELPTYDFGETIYEATTLSNKERVKKGKYKSSRRHQEQESFEEEYEYRKIRNN